jgi:hypothetical protein
MGYCCVGVNGPCVIPYDWYESYYQKYFIFVKDVSPRLPLLDTTSRLPRLTAKWKFVPTRDKRHNPQQSKNF